jgi:cytochrome c-type biogenesis protein CcmH/NrfG
MPAKKTVRFDQMFIIAIACLIVGYLLGVVTFLLIQGKPAPHPPHASAPPPPVAPPSSGLGSYAAEIRELRNIVEQDPGKVDAWVKLGNIYFDTNRYMESIEAYSKALEMQPRNPDVITDRAIMYRRIGDFERAAAGFREAAEMDPNHLNSPFNLGLVLHYDLNDAAGATQAWQMYLERNPPPEMVEKVKKLMEAPHTQE